MTHGLLVLDDGTYAETDVSRRSLEETKVYCVVDGCAKIVYIWIGARAHVRTRFAGATVAASVRRSAGFNYRVVTIDQGAEPPGFFALIDSDQGHHTPTDTSTVTQARSAARRNTA